jgi:hypothetical protein
MDGAGDDGRRQMGLLRFWLCGFPQCNQEPATAPRERIERYLTEQHDRWEIARQVYEPELIRPN